MPEDRADGVSRGLAQPRTVDEQVAIEELGTMKLSPVTAGVSNMVTSAVFLSLVVAGVFPPAVGAGGSEMGSGQGYVDQVVVKRSSGSIALLGWAAAVRRGEQTASVAVQLDDNLIYKGAFERYERPDVVKATGRRELLRSGWKVVAYIPATLTGGRYTVRVTMRLSTGRTFGLNNGAGVSPQDICSSSLPVTLALGLVLALALSVLTAAEPVARYLTTRIGRRISGKKIALLSIVSVFVSFVAAGTTGSSIGLGLTSSPFTNNEVVRLIGKDRPIRSDEWAVFTPFAIGQVNHEPPFPVFNKNIGPDGQNMLVLGMTGVPILHWSAVAKPATWGFFALDLPRALAWYWWFPPFSCLLALWLLLDHVFPGHWRAMLALSIAFTASPYVVAWSFWPAYSVMFPSVVLLATLTICRANSLARLILASALLGISLAGFVLLLYPAWQVPLGYLFLFVFLGLAMRDKLHSDLTPRRALAFASGLAISVVLCWTWWMDARTAIQEMAATLYPGQRATVTWGDIEPWYWAKGLASVVTLYGDTLVGDTNQSDAASFIYLVLPLAASVVLRMWNTRRIDPLVIACGSFILLVSLFQHVGIPRSVSQLSLWGHSTPKRADIALGVAQIFLLGFSLGTEASLRRIGSVALKLVGLLGAVVWVLLSLLSLWQAPDPIWDLFAPSVIMVALVSVASVSYFVIVGAKKPFLIMYVAWMLCVTLPFNPINLAPCSVTSNSQLLSTTELSDNGGSKRSGRILVMGSQVAAMMLVASGRPTLNGVHYYPQHGLWQTLDPMGESRDAYNRYQHLIFLVDTIPGPKSFRIESPQADVVHVVVDGTRFDFRGLGVAEVLAPAQMQQQLDGNESIVKVRSSNGWAVYRVV
jgi:hypothetical protein